MFWWCCLLMKKKTLCLCPLLTFCSIKRFLSFLGWSHWINFWFRVTSYLWISLFIICCIHITNCRFFYFLPFGCWRLVFPLLNHLFNLFKIDSFCLSVDYLSYFLTHVSWVGKVLKKPQIFVKFDVVLIFDPSFDGQRVLLVEEVTYRRVIDEYGVFETSP